ncbi:hypothetical protein B0H11DRAFT_2298317 [Mycena galericulata]|nr:hypothetical protein B0H11DRAFT_2298317 [Mycena galericulata]
MYAPHAPYPGGPPINYQHLVPPPPPISIHTHFSPKFVQIVHYLEYRSQSYPFVDAGDGRRDLWNTIIHKCLTSRRSRCEKPRINPNSPVELECITVTGLHGLQLRISDFYSALGLIITETDPYPYNGTETSLQKDEIHMKMLATYTKWISISGVYFNAPKDGVPSATCIMYVKTSTQAVPILSTSEEPQADGPPVPQTHFIPAALFPNLSAMLKDEALKVQQENLQGFMRGLEFLGIAPLVRMGWGSHFGHCAEALALLYLLDPDTASRCVIDGVATKVSYIHTMNEYNLQQFRKKVTPACANCRYIFRAINEAMGSTRSNGARAFSYNDRAEQDPTKRRYTTVPTSVECDRRTCHNVPAQRSWECPHCNLVWYCSKECMEEDWRTHAPACPRFRRCLVCKKPAHKDCGKCSQMGRLIPVRYCTVEHQREDWPRHKLWCKHYHNRGPPAEMF